MANTAAIRAGKAFVEITTDDSKLLRGLKKAEARMKAFGKTVTQMGMKLVAASAAVITPLAISTKVFASFEQKMARVKALTGATGQDFDRLANEAKRLGESTVFSASQAADAMSFFALAGYDADKILKSIGPTLDMAAAGQLDVAQAADIATKIMAGMGMEADQLGYAVDVLTKAMTTANTDLTMLGDAMKFVGPLAKNAGIAFEEVTAAIQLLSNAGIQGEMAGTTIRGMLLSLTSPSAEAKETLAELGVAVNDAAGNVRPLANILGDLNAGMGGMGTGQKLDVLGRIFSARQASGVAELLAQGADKLREYTDALRGAGGTAARIAGVQLNTLTGDATILKSALEGLGIAVGEALVGPVRVLTQALTKAVAAIAQWVRDNRDLIVMVGAAAAAVGLFGGVLIAFGIAVKVAAFGLGVMLAVLGAIKVALAAVLSPIGLVVAAVAGLGVAIATYTGAGGKALGWLMERFWELRSFVKNVIWGITDALAAGDPALAAQVLWLALKVVWQTGVNWLNSIWVTAKHFFVKTAQEMWYGALTVAEQVWHGLEAAWINTVSFLSKTWTNFVADIQLAWGGVQNWLSQRWIDLFELFGTLTAEQAELAKNLGDEDFANDARGIEGKRNRALGESENRRTGALAAADKEHIATLRQIDGDLKQALAGLNSENDPALQATKDELKAAREALANAIGKARQDREQTEAEQKAGGGGGPGVPNPEDLARAVAARMSVAGTFNKVSLAGMFGGGVNPMVREQKQTNRKLDKIVEKTNNGGLVFG